MDQNNLNSQNSLGDLNNLTSSTSESSSTNILWNENDETFLQNLFANTLLNDDFVEKTDFDLAFDNLQLNYDSNPTETSNQLTILSLEDSNLNIQDLKLDQTNLFSGSDLVITTDENNSDDKLFKKPSCDFLTLNNSLISTKIKKKSDSNTDTIENLDNNTKLKRSMKRSKLMNSKNSNQDILMSKSVPVGKHLKHRQQAISNTNSSTNKNHHKHNTSNCKNQIKQIQHKKLVLKNSTAFSSNDAKLSSLSDLEKSIFVLKESPIQADRITPNGNLGVKRDEFDLQIRELSLLDLHSSEDDSSNQDPKKKNRIPIKLNEITQKAKTINEQSENPNLSETKRIKYSQNSQINEQDEETKSKETKIDSSRSPNSKNKLDKFIQYFKSLDSSTREPIILNQKNSKKSLDSLLSPPSPSNLQKTQNKRKKKDVQQTIINEQRPIILISVQGEQQKQQNSIPLLQPMNIENDTLLHMKNLDLNTEQQSTSARTETSVNLNDKNSRAYLWNLLKSNSTQEELIENFGSCLHDKISFWDLVQLKLKYSKSNHLKTTYEIIDDYTLLYSNMSALLERFVSEQSNINSFMSKSDSSRSRSSSRNVRKQSNSGSNR